MITSYVFLDCTRRHNLSFVKHQRYQLSSPVPQTANEIAPEQSHAMQTAFGAKWKCNFQACVSRESPFLQEKKFKQPHGNTLISALTIRGDGCCRSWEPGNLVLNFKYVRCQEILGDVECLVQPCTISTAESGGEPEQSSYWADWYLHWSHSTIFKLRAGFEKPALTAVYLWVMRYKMSLEVATFSAVWFWQSATCVCQGVKAGADACSSACFQPSALPPSNVPTPKPVNPNRSRAGEFFHHVPGLISLSN